MSVSEELEDLSILDEMDIPEVVRDESSDFVPATLQRSTALSQLLFGIGGMVLLSVSAIALWQTLGQRTDLASTPAQTSAPTPPPPASNPTTPASSGDGQILGHFPYEEAPASELVALSPDGRLKLRAAAAEKFQEMQADARRDGINLTLISGFRTLEEQKYLFFEVKEQRAQDTTKRAEVSAPPGHSEHHTGYAVDIGDGDVPATNLKQSFENTAAFRWLQNNAARYSFELSFPKDNEQGIAYEPWHWRFVGDQDSLETFYRSRQQGTAQQP